MYIVFRFILIFRKIFHFYEYDSFEVKNLYLDMEPCISEVNFFFIIPLIESAYFVGDLRRIKSFECRKHCVLF